MVTLAEADSGTVAGGASGGRGAGRDDSRGAVSVVQTAVLETHRTA